MRTKFDAAFGRNEAVKCALAGNLWHYHDDPATLWWIFFAAAQGGYLQSGGRYVKTGSQRLSSALARTILRSEGCAVALRRVVTGIGIGDDGRANSITHIAKAGGDPQTVEADCIISNAAPGITASLLPEPGRSEAVAKLCRPCSVGVAVCADAGPVAQAGRNRTLGLLDAVAARLDG